MAVDIPSRISLRMKVTTVITIIGSLFLSGATAVSSLYKFRDAATKAVLQQQQTTLQRYLDRAEFVRSLSEMNQREDDRYADLKDRINAVGTKVDGVIVFIRHRL